MTGLTMTFRCEQGEAAGRGRGYGPTVTEVRVELYTLDEALDAFEMFLRGCGYNLEGIEERKVPCDEDRKESV